MSANTKWKKFLVMKDSMLIQKEIDVDLFAMSRNSELTNGYHLQNKDLFISEMHQYCHIDKQLAEDIFDPLRKVIEEDHTSFNGISLKELVDDHDELIDIKSVSCPKNCNRYLITYEDHIIGILRFDRSITAGEDDFHLYLYDLELYYTHSGNKFVDITYDDFVMAEKEDMFYIPADSFYI